MPSLYDIVTVLVTWEVLTVIVAITVTAIVLTELIDRRDD